MISPQQYRKLMKNYQMTGKIGQSADKAGVDRKTARKFIGGAPGPLEPRSARRWKTHEDAFAPIWAEVEEMLLRESGLQAKVVFEEVLRRYPGRYREEGIARVGRQGYSVPARWIGRRLRARLSETEIGFYSTSTNMQPTEGASRSR
jgi:hypothetical protein